MPTDREREPDLEDPKLAVWAGSTKEADIDSSNDETRLRLDFQTEEMYESRVYGLTPFPELVSIYASLGKITPQEVGDIIAETSIKVLAKRNLHSGQISYLIVFVSGEEKGLIDKGNVFGESEYRDQVVAYLEKMVDLDIVTKPTVIDPEEWASRREEHLKLLQQRSGNS